MVRCRIIFFLLFVSSIAFTQTPTFPRFRLIQLQQSDTVGQMIMSDTANNAFWSSDLRVQDSVFYIFGEPYLIDSTRLDNDTLKYYQNGSLVGFDLIATLVDSTRLDNDTLKYYQNGNLVGFDIVALFVDSTRLYNDTLKYFQNGVLVGYDIISITDDQQLSINIDTVFLEDGGFIVLPSITDTSGYNLDFTYNNDTITITDGLSSKSITIPTALVDSTRLNVTQDSLLYYQDGVLIGKAELITGGVIWRRIVNDIYYEEGRVSVGDSLFYGAFDITGQVGTNAGAYNFIYNQNVPQDYPNANLYKFYGNTVLGNNNIDTLGNAGDTSNLYAYTNTVIGAFNLKQAVEIQNNLVFGSSNLLNVPVAYENSIVGNNVANSASFFQGNSIVASYSFDGPGVTNRFIRDVRVMGNGIIDRTKVVDNVTAIGANIARKIDSLVEHSTFIGELVFGDAFGVNTPDTISRTIAIGDSSFYNSTRGINLLAIGNKAGYSNTFNNVILIGNNTEATVDNEVVLGKNPSQLTSGNYRFNVDQDTTGLNNYFLKFNSQSGQIELQDVVVSSVDTSGFNRVFELIGDTLYIEDDSNRFLVLLDKYLDNTDTSGYNIDFSISNDTITLTDGLSTKTIIIPNNNTDTSGYNQAFTLQDSVLYLQDGDTTIALDIKQVYDNTDTSGYNSSFSIVNSELFITDGNSTLSVDLTPYVDNTDTSGYNRTFTLSGDTLYITDDNSQLFVDLSPLNNIGLDTSGYNDTLYINSNILYLQDGMSIQQADLSPYLDNTDESGHNVEFYIGVDTLLYIRDDSSTLNVDLRPFYDNTDNQILSSTKTQDSIINHLGLLTSAYKYTIYLTNGDSVIIYDTYNDADNSSSNELQDLQLNNNILRLTFSNSTIDLTPYLAIDSTRLNDRGDSLIYYDENGIIYKEHISTLLEVLDACYVLDTLGWVYDTSYNLTSNVEGDVYVTIQMGDVQGITGPLITTSAYTTSDIDYIIKTLKDFETEKDSVYAEYGGLPFNIYIQPAGRGFFEPWARMFENNIIGWGGNNTFVIGSDSTEQAYLDSIVALYGFPSTFFDSIPSAGTFINITHNSYSVYTGYYRLVTETGNQFYWDYRATIGASFPSTNFTNHMTSLSTYLPQANGNYVFKNINIGPSYYYNTNARRHIYLEKVHILGAYLNPLTYDAITDSINGYPLIGSSVDSVINTLTTPPSLYFTGLDTLEQNNWFSTVTDFKDIQGVSSYSIDVKGDFLVDTASVTSSILNNVTFDLTETIDSTPILDTLSISLWQDFSNNILSMRTIYSDNLLITADSTGCIFISDTTTESQYLYLINDTLRITGSDSIVDLKPYLPLTEEQIQDTVAQFINAGLGIDISYDDANNELLIESKNFEEIGKNVTQDTLLKGYPVYQVDTLLSGNLVGVAYADAADPSKMPAVGVLEQDLLPGEEGKVLFSGYISGVNTSSFTSGDVVYVAAGGGYTNIRPVGEGNLIQNLGRVLKVHPTNGSGIIMGAGRSNDVPNLNPGNIFYGNVDSLPSIVPLDSLMDRTRLSASGDSLLYYQGDVLIGFDTLIKGGGIVQEKYIGDGVSNTLQITSYNGLLPTDSNNVLVFRNGLFIDSEYITALDEVAGTVQLSFIPDLGDRMMIVWFTGTVVVQSGGGGIDTIYTSQYLSGNGSQTNPLTIDTLYTASKAYVDNSIASSGSGDITGVNETPQYGINGGAATGAVLLSVDTTVIASKTYVGNIVSSNVDSTRLVADSILIYYDNTGEIRRDTIRLPGGGTGDITSVNQLYQYGITGGGSSGDITLKVDTSVIAAKSWVTNNTVSSVSSFMSNGSNNRIVTATGTDGQNAEERFTYNTNTNTATIVNSLSTTNRPTLVMQNLQGNSNGALIHAKHQQNVGGGKTGVGADILKIQADAFGGYIGLHEIASITLEKGIGNSEVYTDQKDGGQILFKVQEKDYGPYHTAMTIDHQGDIGINNTTPVYDLDVNGSINFTGDLYKNGVVFSGGGGTGYWTQTGNDIYYTAGDVGVNTNSPNYRLHVSGSLFCDTLYSGGWYPISDINLKENIVPIKSALDSVLQINTVEYNFIGKPGKRIGVIAQEIELIYPELVATGPNGTKGVNYIELIPLLIKSIQEQQEIINNLQEEISKLKE